MAKVQARQEIYETGSDNGRLAESGIGRSSLEEIPMTDFSSLSEEDRVIAAMGYKPELDRAFGKMATFSFALSISGLFATTVTTLVYPLIAGGAPAVFWCWFIGMFGCMSIVLSVAELVSAFPSSGGLYYATSRLVPDEYIPIVCCITGLSNLLGQAAGYASTVYGCAQLLLAAVSIGTDFTYLPDQNQTVAVMVGLAAFHGLVNSLSTRWLDRITKYYAVFHGVVLVACCVTLLVMQKDKSSARTVFVDIKPSSGWSSTGFSFLFGILSISWTITDSDAVAHIAEEIKDAAVVAPIAIVSALSVTCIVGLLFNLILAFCLGDVDALLASPIQQPAAQLFANVMGNTGGVVFSICAFIVLNQTALTALQSLGRTTYALSRDELLPLSRFWRRVSAVTQTPILAVWISLVFCVLINLLGLASYQAVLAIFSVTAIALDSSYAIPIACKVIFTKRLNAEGKGFRPGPWNLGRWSWYINVWAVTWTFVISIVFLFPETVPVTAATMNYASVLLVAIFLGAWLYWILKAHKSYTGPRAAVGETRRKSTTHVK